MNNILIQTSPVLNPSKLSIIWDITKYCPWNCNICCMGASNHSSCISDELTSDKKLEVILQIAELKNRGIDVRTDLSGGELLMDPYHLKVINHLSNILGKEKVGISTSGCNLTEETANFLASKVNDVELTMDVVPNKAYALRPQKYHITALKAVELLKNAGCTVGLQTVACKYNFNYDDIKGVFDLCCQHNVDNWSILRFFPSGRGQNYKEAEMNNEDYLQYVNLVKHIENVSTESFKPEIDFHYLIPGHPKHTGICRCVKKSIGILPNGDVTACFWALDKTTHITDSKYYLGNVCEQSLWEILNSDRAKYWLSCEHTCSVCA